MVVVRHYNNKVPNIKKSNLLAKNTPQIITYVHTTHHIKSHSTNDLIQQTNNSSTYQKYLLHLIMQSKYFQFLKQRSKCIKMHETHILKRSHMIVTCTEAPLTRLTTSYCYNMKVSKIEWFHMHTKNTTQVITYAHTTHDIKSHSTNNLIQQNPITEYLHNTYHI